jgi:L-lysine 2,3-aminomutase
MAIVTISNQSVRATTVGVQLTWQEELKQAIRSPVELCQILDLPLETAFAANLAAADFPLFVPRSFARKMRPGEKDDPLLLQVLPQDLENASEFQNLQVCSTDPLREADVSPVPGLLHKYQGRALLITAGVCAVHCRYCFRRHFPYDETPKSMKAWEPALNWIEGNDSIDEVILSGGDPLILNEASLTPLLTRLDAIGHLRRLRIHTRLPIMIPQRVTQDLTDLLKSLRLSKTIVLHANHAQELCADVAAAVSRLLDADAMVLNQAVLLRGINDTVEKQFDLCSRLVDLRALPYYLHQLDAVKGAMHFQVPLERGRAIVAELRARLPGYAVPRYVQELPGAKSKTPL